VGKIAGAECIGVDCFGTNRVWTVEEVKDPDEVGNSSRADEQSNTRRGVLVGSGDGRVCLNSGKLVTWNRDVESLLT
jgi:hypothetical protein